MDHSMVACCVKLGGYERHFPRAFDRLGSSLSVFSNSALGECLSVISWTAFGGNFDGLDASKWGESNTSMQELFVLGFVKDLR
jgi:hypothetical protein